MKTADALKLPLHALALLGPQKSFARNPILGSRRLNALGLHTGRVRAAHAMAAFRRRGLRVAAEDAAAYARDGYVMKRDYLEPALFERLRDEILGTPMPSREFRQGQTVTRQVPVSAATRGALPTAWAVSRDPALNALVRHVGSYGGWPLWVIQTVIADPDTGDADPQTELHSDTFYPTAKAWLFLHDVTEEDGPFAYVPGSHQASDARLAWEREAAMTAKADARSNHRGGSLRVGPAELTAMGLPAPIRVAVPANTLVVADTHGFHGRTPSAKPTVRTVLHAHHRSMPFQTWSGFDAKSWPWIRDRQFEAALWLHDRRVRRGRKVHWHEAPAALLDGPAHI